MAAGANPLDPTVVSGSAVFTTTGNTLRIENTSGAIINWQSFSIGAGELTHFQQQSAASQVLNRVNGGDPSVILGMITSNGRVALISPNGIAFGPRAVVDVAGFLASTLDITNADFLASRLSYRAHLGSADASIRNEGTLRAASGGRIYLVAPTIENTGLISAPDGSVVLAAGHSVTLVDSNRPDVQVQLTAGAGEMINVGTIVGGQVGIYGAILRNSGGGSISATAAVADQNGLIRLTTGPISVNPGDLSNPNTLLVINGGSVTRSDGNSSIGLSQSGGIAPVPGGTITLGNGGTRGNAGSSGGGTLVLSGTATVSTTGSSGGGAVVATGNGNVVPRATKRAVSSAEQGALAPMDPTAANVTAAERAAQFPFARQQSRSGDDLIVPSFR